MGNPSSDKMIETLNVYINGKSLFVCNYEELSVVFVKKMMTKYMRFRSTDIVVRNIIEQEKVGN